MIRKIALFFCICYFVNLALVAGSNGTPSLSRHDVNDEFKRFFQYEKEVTLSQEKNLIAHVRFFSIGPDHHFWVLDSKKKKIYKYNRDGKFVLGIGGAGQGPGEFMAPLDLCFGKENFYVVDPSARKVNVFTHGGKFKYFFSIQDGRIIREGQNGDLIIAAPWVAESGKSSCIHIYDREGTHKRSFLPINKEALRHNLISDGVSFDLDLEGNIYCVQEMENKIHHYTISGQPVNTFSEIKSYYIPPPQEKIKNIYLRSEAEKWLKSWSHMDDIHRLDHLLLVSLRYYVGPFDYRWDIYNKDGTFIKGGLAGNIRLLYVDDNEKLYFLKETNHTDDSGDTVFTVLIYCLRNKKA